MDALVRSRRLLLTGPARTAVHAAIAAAITWLGTLGAGCSAPPLQGVGRGTDTPRVTLPDAGTTAAPSTPVVAPDYATRLSRVGPDSFVSSGHAGGRYAVTVYVTPAAKDTLFRAVAAPGTEIAMATLERASHTRGPTLFMVKEAAGTWRFGTDATTDPKSEGLLLCARCHAEAPGDHVFALPE